MPFSKEIIGFLVVVLIGAGVYIWRVESQLEVANQELGRLEAENRQISQDLKDSEISASQTRQEMRLWRDLYTTLQNDFKEIRQRQRQAERQLNELRGQENVEEYLRCPMPDPVYDWVRNN